LTLNSKLIQDSSWVGSAVHDARRNQNRRIVSGACGQTAGQQNSAYQLISVCGASSLSVALAHLTWRNVSGWQRWASSSNRSSVAACAPWASSSRSTESLRRFRAAANQLAEPLLQRRRCRIARRQGRVRSAAVHAVPVRASCRPVRQELESGARPSADSCRSARASGHTSRWCSGSLGFGDPVPPHVSRLPSRSRSKRQSRDFSAGIISACMFLCIIVSAASPSLGSMCATASGATTTEKCRT